MAIKMAIGGGDYEPMEAGIHDAVCTLVADLGMQETAFGEKHKVYLRFEVPGQTFEFDGQEVPMSIGAKYTASLNPRANLRKALISWFGGDLTDEEWTSFDLESVVSKPATLVVGHYKDREGKQRASIENITKYRGQTEIVPSRGTQVFGESSTDAELADAPEWIRKAIEANREPANQQVELENQQAQQASQDEDIPF